MRIWEHQQQVHFLGREFGAVCAIPAQDRQRWGALRRDLVAVGGISRGCIAIGISSTAQSNCAAAILTGIWRRSW